MVVHRDLIFDIGAHDGSDTAYYLTEGYRVVAVEPDATLAALIRARFASELDNGKLNVLEVAITPSGGPAEMWICDSVSEWNSLDGSFATRLGMRAHAVPVTSICAEELFDRYGAPFYMKVDIEGYDRHCVHALNPASLPTYMSIELNDLDDLIALRSAGYACFKLIHQNRRFGHRQFRAAPAPDADGAAFRGTGSRPSGPSGPFGENSAGKWLSFDEVMFDFLSFTLGHTHFGDPPEWSIWFDVHATGAS